jgi:hypothetical protein
VLVGFWQRIRWMHGVFGIGTSGYCQVVSEASLIHLTVTWHGSNVHLSGMQVRQALTEAFADCGAVNQVRLPTDRETGELKGIAFVEFADSDGKVRHALARLIAAAPMSHVSCYVVRHFVRIVVHSQLNLSDLISSCVNSK